MTTDLNSAIQDLKTTIAAEGYTTGLVAEVAEDWGIDPVLLARKFEEATVMAAAARFHAAQLAK